MNRRSVVVGLLGVVLTLPGVRTTGAETESLPSWNEGAAKQSIVTFVQAVADVAGPQHVPPAARIAVFDNDGTL